MSNYRLRALKRIMCDENAPYPDRKQAQDIVADGGVSKVKLLPGMVERVDAMIMILKAEDKEKQHANKKQKTTG